MKLWYLIFYTFYKVDLFLFKIINKINPIIFIYLFSFFRDKKDQIEEATEEVFVNREIGINIFRATYLMCGLISVLVLTVTNFIVVLIGVKVNHSIESMIGLVLVASLFNNFVLLKEENYIKAFDEFDSLSKKKRYLGYLTSLFVVVVAFLLLFISFFGNANKYYIG